MGEASEERKLRADAWEAGLPEALRERFYAALDGADYAAGLKLAMQEPFNLPAVSLKTFYKAHARARAAVVRGKALSALETAAKVAPMLKTVGAKVTDADMADTLASLAATAALEGAGEKTVSALGSLACGFRSNALRAEANRQKDAALRLAREKFEAAERRLAAIEGAVDAPALTDAERVAKIKSIFGMGARA